MKALILVLLCSTAQAKEFKFSYTLDGYNFQYSTDANSWEEAFERGSQSCLKFFVNKKPLNEDRVLDIVDVCANPK